LSRSSVAAWLVGLFCISACSSEPPPTSRPSESIPLPPAPPPPHEIVEAPVVVEASAAFNPRLLRRFKPARELMPSASNRVTEAKVELGRMLFYDKRLSRASDVSCNSCHDLGSYGVDGRVTSRGDSGQLGSRNAPSVYHAAASIAQFWDGRAATVEEQATFPMLNPREMAMPTPSTLVQRLRGIPGYTALFERAFPDALPALTFEHAAQAIGAFERRLTTRSRWDAYLDGDSTALSPDEIEGLKLFTNVGCLVCHTGELLGGNSYQKVGVALPWPDQSDQGRFAITGDPGDRMHFKVPTLRNVAMTAPYFHDGSVAALPDAVRAMGRYQLGLELPDDDVGAIVMWLASLTGDLPSEYIQPPTLPPDPWMTGAP
jgi:cytochrome c peroxidase